MLVVAKWCMLNLPNFSKDNYLNLKSAPCAVWKGPTKSSALCAVDSFNASGDKNSYLLTNLFVLVFRVFYGNVDCGISRNGTPKNQNVPNLKVKK